MITEDQLLAAGYRPFKPHPASTLASRGFQKWIIDGASVLSYQPAVVTGTRLFMLIFYEWSGHQQLKDPPIVYSAEARFYLPGNEGCGFDIKYHERGSLDVIEAFFLEAYHSLKCVPDPHNQR